jgi:hypothetical protein
MDLEANDQKAMFVHKLLESKEAFMNCAKMRRYIKQLVDVAMERRVESEESQVEEDS